MNLKALRAKRENLINELETMVSGIETENGEIRSLSKEEVADFDAKKQEIEKRRKKIKALLEQDFKRKDICSQLDISIKTYKRDISFLKEQGLI